MNRPFPAVVVATVIAMALALGPLPALACGEGLFNMGQGLRYQGYLAPHPASVLVLDTGTVNHQSLYAGLREAGHSVTVVASPDALASSMGSRRFDVVIAAINDAAAVARSAGATERPRLLPVIARNQRNAPEVLGRFKLFVIDGASLGQYLKAIDKLLALRG